MPVAVVTVAGILFLIIIEKKSGSFSDSILQLLVQK